MRNKAFFFFNYEGTRIKQGLSRISTVPLDNERIGDFSADAAAAAGVAPYPTIYNLSTVPDADQCQDLRAAACSVNNSFQSDPSAHIDAAVAKLMALFPEPNYNPGSATFPDVNNFSRTGASRTSTTATTRASIGRRLRPTRFRPFQLLQPHPRHSRLPGRTC